MATPESTEEFLVHVERLYMQQYARALRRILRGDANVVISATSSVKDHLEHILVTRILQGLKPKGIDRLLIIGDSRAECFRNANIKRFRTTVLSIPGLTWPGIKTQLMKKAELFDVCLVIGLLCDTIYLRKNPSTGLWNMGINEQFPPIDFENDLAEFAGRVRSCGKVIVFTFPPPIDFKRFAQVKHIDLNASVAGNLSRAHFRLLTELKDKLQMVSDDVPLLDIGHLYFQSRTISERKLYLNSFACPNGVPIFPRVKTVDGVHYSRPFVRVLVSEILVLLKKAISRGCRGAGTCMPEEEDFPRSVKCSAEAGEGREEHSFSPGQINNATCYYWGVNSTLSDKLPALLPTQKQEEACSSVGEILGTSEAKLPDNHNNKAVFQPEGCLPDDSFASKLNTELTSLKQEVFCRAERLYCQIYLEALKQVEKGDVVPSLTASSPVRTHLMHDAMKLVLERMNKQVAGIPCR